MTRRSLLRAAGPAAAFGAVAGYMRFGEPNWFEVSEIPIRISRWPAGAELRALHLSDLHLSRPVSSSQLHRAIDLALPLRPDIIFLTGDYVTALDPSDLEELRRILKRIAAAAPAYAVMGNHDGGEWSKSRGWTGTHDQIDRMLAGCGIRVLHNSSCLVEQRGIQFHLAGVGDLWSNEVDSTRAFGDVHGRLPTILLAHNPDSKDLVSAHSWDLMLSGHTHGGQLLIPLGGTPFAPVDDKRFVAGLHAWNNRQIYITRGLGNIYGLRLNCRPEISLLRLQSASAG